MRTNTTARIGAVGAGTLLALGIFAAAPPAGASGTHGRNSADTTCFTATGKTQGRSHSDPDGMSNGGADKPGCTGGFDADKDGNNGCGNDADREDDNNGNCGGPKTKPPATDAGKAKVEDEPNTTAAAAPGPVTVSGTGAVAATTMSVTGSDAAAGAAGTTGPAGTEVLGAATTAPGVSAAPAGTGTDFVAPATQVLGQTITRPSALARTGAGVGGMALLGIVLCGSGRLAALARRLLRIS